MPVIMKEMEKAPQKNISFVLADIKHPSKVFASPIAKLRQKRFPANFLFRERRRKKIS